MKIITFIYKNKCTYWSPFCFWRFVYYDTIVVDGNIVLYTLMLWRWWRRSAVKRNDIKRRATRALLREPAEDPIVIGYRTNMADARGPFLRVSVCTHTRLYILKLYTYSHTRLSTYKMYLVHDIFMRQAGPIFQSHYR